MAIITFIPITSFFMRHQETAEISFLPPWLMFCAIKTRNSLLHYRTYHRCWYHTSFRCSFLVKTITNTNSNTCLSLNPPIAAVALNLPTLYAEKDQPEQHSVLLLVSSLHGLSNLTLLYVQTCFVLLQLLEWLAIALVLFLTALVFNMTWC